MKAKESRIKVLHVPGNIGGNPQSIAGMERRLGIDSHCVSLYPTAFAYPADEVLFSDKSNVFQRQYKRLKLIARAVREFDIIHYNFGTTIADPPYPRDPNWDIRYPAFAHWPYWLYASGLQRLELYLMKRLGKIVFVTYQGDDARQGWYCQKNFNISVINDGGQNYYPLAWDREKQRRIALFDKAADKIYALNPDILHVLPKRSEFLPYCNVDLNDWCPVATQNTIPRVVHAPSNPGMKGTRHVLAAVSRLREEGIEFNFELVENMTNSQARKLYEKADLLVDQLLVGWYGGLAVELMALGKPVICYLRQNDLRYIPEKMREQLPIIQAEPDNIYDVLKQWLTKRRSDLQQQGETSRKYVEMWHDLGSVTKKIVNDYTLAIETRNNSNEIA